MVSKYLIQFLWQVEHWWKYWNTQWTFQNLFPFKTSSFLNYLFFSYTNSIITDTQIRELSSTPIQSQLKLISPLSVLKLSSNFYLWQNRKSIFYSATRTNKFDFLQGLSMRGSLGTISIFFPSLSQSLQIFKYPKKKICNHQPHIKV